jgi:class 3 adenylate cyclase
MVGYSRLMEADETGTIARQKAHRAELVDPEIGAHGGRIVKTTGDGILIEFPSVVAATECAVAIQRAMAEREAEVGDERRIQYRVGIYLGRNWTPSNTALLLLLLQTTTFVPFG